MPAMVCTWSLEGSLQKLVFSLYHEDPGGGGWGWTQVLRLSRKHLHLLSHLAGHTLKTESVFHWDLWLAD